MDKICYLGQKKTAHTICPKFQPTQEYNKRTKLTQALKKISIQCDNTSKIKISFFFKQKFEKNKAYLSSMKNLFLRLLME